MQLPIDAVALFNEMADIKTAREMPLSVSVYIDDTAPTDLVAHVRGAFASTASTVRMTLSYLDRTFMPQAEDDIAIVVAGDSAKVGAAAKAIRAIGVPVMVVTLSPVAVAKRAETAGSAIPEGDIVSPLDEVEEDREEPVDFDDEAVAALDARMGRWIVSVSREKRLAFAIAFPFMRRPLALDSVETTSLQNAAIGLIPFIPGADLPLMTLNQAKMVLQIASAYGHEMDTDRWKELAAVIGSAYVCRTLAREITEFVPFLGFIVRPGIGYGGTAALGHALIDYYEGGENVNGVANVATRAAEAGTKLISKVRGFVADPSSVNVVDKVNGYVPVVREAVDKYVPVVRDAVGEYAPKIVDTATDIVSKAVAK